MLKVPQSHARAAITLSQYEMRTCQWMDTPVSNVTAH